jgi:CRISPR-associated protein Cas1
VEPTLQRLAQLQALSLKALDANQLRELEGSAAAMSFRGFGYGMVLNALLLRVELIGLDPYVGVFHVGSQRHAALVSDLFEPLRTFLVDPFHGQLIRAGTISATDHFYSHGGGLFLNDDGRRLWLAAWTEFMAETITLTDGSIGLRWEVLDQLVYSFARFVDEPGNSLAVPLRR